MNRKNIIQVITVITLLLFSACGAGSAQRRVPQIGDRVCFSERVSDTAQTETMVRIVSFEDLLLTATDVVRATCVARWDNPDGTEYEFLITHRFAGEDTGDTIFVRQSFYNIATPVAEAPSFYENGETYYLVLSRTVSVYYPHDRYSSCGKLLRIPAADISQSELYGYRLFYYAGAKPYRDERYMAAYIQKILAARGQVPAYHGIDYLHEKEMPVVVRQADAVLLLEIVSAPQRRQTPLWGSFTCHVAKDPRGLLPVGTEVRLIAPETLDVEKGKRYIFALAYDKASGSVRQARLAAPESFYPESAYADVCAALIEAP